MAGENMTPEETYADRFADAVVVLMNDLLFPGVPLSEEDRKKNKVMWLPIGKAIYRANTGAGSP